MKKLLFLSLAISVITLSFVACRSKNNATPKIRIENKGVFINYSDTGKGDITLLFVHGWCINKSYWSAQEASFSKDYRVVSMDLPGFGQSGKNRTDWTNGAFGTDVSAVIHQLDLKQVILIGHSMAGDIIVESAINDPERVIGLVGVDNFKNFGSVWDSASRKNYEAAIELLKHNFKKIAGDYFNSDLFYTTTDSSLRKRILNDVFNSDSTIATACMEDHGYDETARVIAARKKLYLINSDVTHTDSSGFIKHKIAFEVFPIHATGHFPMAEKPAEFNAALQRVISEIESKK